MSHVLYIFEEFTHGNIGPLRQYLRQSVVEKDFIHQLLVNEINKGNFSFFPTYLDFIKDFGVSRFSSFELNTLLKQRPEHFKRYLRVIKNSDADEIILNQQFKINLASRYNFCNSILYLSENVEEYAQNLDLLCWEYSAILQEKYELFFHLSTIKKGLHLMQEILISVAKKELYTDYAPIENFNLHYERFVLSQTLPDSESSGTFKV